MPPFLSAPRLRKPLRLLGEVLLVVMSIAAIRLWQHHGMAAGSAPPLAGTAIDGTPLAVPAADGRPTLVLFWGSWCPVCRLEMPAAAAAAQEQRVVTVAMQSGSDAELRAYLAKEGLQLPVLNDPAGEIAAAWGVRAVPAAFVVDGAGQIRFRETGYTSGPGLRLRLWWAGR